MAPSYLVNVSVMHANSPNGVMLIQANVSRDKLEAHSRQARRFFDNFRVAQEAHRDILLPYGVPAALSKLLTIINTHEGRARFFVGGLSSMTTAQRCYVWQACDILDLNDEEAWAQVTAGINYRISHSMLTPESMRAVQQVFCRYQGDPVKGKTWAIFVNQYAWDTLQNKYSEEQQKALDVELLNHPDLQQAIVSREKELRPRVLKYSKHQQENATHDRATKHARSQRKYEGGQERLRRKHAQQVLNGERAYYIELEPYLQELKSQRKAGSE